MEKLDILYVADIWLTKEVDSNYIGHRILDTICRENGFLSEVFSPQDIAKNIDDGELSPEAAIERIAADLISIHPRIYSFYCVCDSFPLTCLVAKKVKKSNEDSIIVMAGPQASALRNEIAYSLPYVDFVAYSEGEKMIVDFLNAVISGSPRIEDVSGITYKDNTGSVVTHEPPRVLNEKELETSIRIGTKKLHSEDTEFSIEGGRGCPFNCTFCITSKYWGRQHRLIAPRTLIDIILEHVGDDCKLPINIVHDHFTANRTFITDFSNELIARGNPIKWSCSSRIDSLDRALIDLLQKSNCVSIYFGIETGSAVLQKKINKNLDITGLIDTIQYLSEKKIETTTSFIIGFPEETLTDFKETMHLIQKLWFVRNNYIQLHMLEFYPKTQETDRNIQTLFFDRKSTLYLGNKRSQLCEESIRLIESSEELFSSYYNMFTDIRKRYGSMPLFFEIISNARMFYRSSLELLFRKRNIIEVYEQNKALIENEVMAEIRGFDDAYLRYKEVDIAKRVLMQCCKNDFELKCFVYIESLMRMLALQEKIFIVINPKFDLLQMRRLSMYFPTEKEYILHSYNHKCHIITVDEKSRLDSLRIVLIKNGFYEMSEENLKREL